MDDSPIPRCNLKSFVAIACAVLAVVIVMQINVNTYAAIDDSDCFGVTSALDFEDIGITRRNGATVPSYCCAFFALKKRKPENRTKAIPPLSCNHYARILNC